MSAESIISEPVELIPFIDLMDDDVVQLAEHMHRLTWQAPTQVMLKARGLGRVASEHYTMEDSVATCQSYRDRMQRKNRIDVPETYIINDIRAETGELLGLAHIFPSRFVRTQALPLPPKLMRQLHTRPRLFDEQPVDIVSAWVRIPDEDKSVSAEGYEQEVTVPLSSAYWQLAQLSTRAVAIEPVADRPLLEQTHGAICDAFFQADLRDQLFDAGIPMHASECPKRSDLYIHEEKQPWQKA
jgi:hypothetical protein